MVDAVVLFTMFCTAMGAAVVGINNEPVVKAGRLSALHRKLNVDLRSRSEIANGRAAEAATRMAAAIAIASILVLWISHILS